MDCNIAEVMILSFKSCESLLFSNLFQRDYLFVLLEDKQKGKSEGVDRPWMTHFYPWFISVLTTNYYIIQSI